MRSPRSCIVSSTRESPLSSGPTGSADYPAHRLITGSCCARPAWSSAPISRSTRPGLAPLRLRESAISARSACSRATAPMPSVWSGPCSVSAATPSPICRPAAPSPNSTAGWGSPTLDTTTYLLPNLPWPTFRGVRVLTAPDQIGGAIEGAAQRIFEDHRSAPAALHLLLIDGDEQCYLIARRDRRKNLPVFATVVYVSNQPLFARRMRTILARLGLTSRAPLTLLEQRIGGCRPAGSVPLSRPRPRMFKSRTLSADAVDYLYSELTQIAW